MKILILLLLGMFVFFGPTAQCAPCQAVDTPKAPTSDQDELDTLFLDAELLLDSQRKPKEAARLFLKIWKDRNAPRILKAKALAGLIRCERLQGNEKKAASLLRELVADFGDLPAISREILRLSTGVPGSSYISAVEVIPEGLFLDLDTGGVTNAIRSGSGSAPDLVVRNDEVVFLDGSRLDHEMAGLAQRIYSAPWHMVHTDLGRCAWVQVISTSAPVGVRFYTALTSTQSVLPAPRNLFCVGTGKRIEVHFEASDIFSSYRVERSDGAAGPFHILDTPGKGPFRDDDVAPGSRYVYRITGIAANMCESLPATVDGTTDCGGVVTGSFELDRSAKGKRSFDFLTGKHVDSGGDITLTGTYGGSSAASFADCFGVHATPLPNQLGAQYSGWGKQIPPHIPFHVYLRGGGVARCTWKPVPQVEVLVEYEANPDAAYFDLRPKVVAEKKAGCVVVTVDAPEGYKADRVKVTDAVGSEARFLTVKNGLARDGRISGKRFLLYSTVCVDKHGRRTAPGSAVVNLSPKGIRKGEFRIHYQQAYSIDLGKIVPDDKGDLYFAGCAGGISSVTLQAQGGINNLEWGRDRDSAISRCGVDELFDAIVSVDPETVALGWTADGDSRDPYDDVFILRTRYGGWAKLAIVARSNQGSWQEKPVTIRYAYNAHEPNFIESVAAETSTEHGVTFDWSILEKSAEKVALLEGRILADLDREAGNLAASLAENIGKEVHVDALLGRSHASMLNLPDDYRVSTFSFEYATRDDRELVKNDWDIAFGNGGPEIDLFGMSSIWDLGAADFDSVAVADGHSYKKADEAPAVKGHVYVIHSIDRNTDLWAKLQIIDQRQDQWIIFRWEIIEEVEQVIRLERAR